MVKKLILFLKSRIGSRLLFETLIAAFLLWFVAQTSFAWWAVLFFSFWLFRIYFSHLPRMRDFWFSFLALVIFSIVGLVQLNFINFSSFIIPIFFAGVLFIILGISNFLFKNNQAAYNFLNTLLMVVGFLFFFTMSFVWWRSIVLALFLFFLFREVFNFYEIVWRRRVLIVSLVFVSIALELGMIVSFLPLGPLNASAFLALFLFLVRDVIIAFFQGRLGLSNVFRQITIFVAITIMIFAASTWSL